MRQASNSRNRPAKRRVKALTRNVTPVVVKSSRTSSQATIPVSIRTTGNSPEAKALIPVEVQNAAGKSVKRAAVIPVRVRTGSGSRKSTRQPHPHVRRKPHANRSRAAKARRHNVIKQVARRQNQDLFTKSVVVLTTAEETAVNMAGNVAKGALHAMSEFLQASFRMPFIIAGNTADKAQRLYEDAKDLTEELAA